MGSGTLTRSTKWQGSATQTTTSQTYTFATANKVVDKDIALTVTLSDSNLLAGNIKKGTTIFGTTGSLDYVKTVSSLPSTKDTSIVYNSSTSKYYVWRD